MLCMPRTFVPCEEPCQAHPARRQPAQKNASARSQKVSTAVYEPRMPMGNNPKLRDPRAEQQQKATRQVGGYV